MNSAWKENWKTIKKLQDQYEINMRSMSTSTGKEIYWNEYDFLGTSFAHELCHLGYNIIDSFSNEFHFMPWDIDKNEIYLTKHSLFCIMF